MANRRDGALHDENVSASFLRDSSKFRRALWDRADGRGRAVVLHLADAGRDQIFLNRLLINFLEQTGDLGLVGFDNFLEDFPRIFVARLHAFEVQDGEPAKFAHGDGETHVDDAVHGAGENRNFEFERLGVAARQTPGDVDLVRIDRDPARHERDFVEPVGDASFAISADPHSHN